MATPSITSVTPNVAPTGGGVLVEIAGESFQLAAPANAVGPAAPSAPTVAVFVGGREASAVDVVTSARLRCVIPPGDVGSADVLVQNLDSAGAPIPEEVAIAPAAFVYARPPLAVEADLTRLVRVLLQELKRQVVANVVLTVHTDFDSELGAELYLAHIAELPGLVLLGPELSEDRFFSINQRPEVSTGLGQFAVRRAPYTVDLAFTVVGVTDSTTELLNLMAATQLFFHRNKYLSVDRDPDNAGADQVRYEMDIAPDGGLKVTSQPNESNVRSFSGRFVLRGFDFEDLAGFPGESVVSRGAVAGEVTLPPLGPVAGDAGGSTP